MALAAYFLIKYEVKLKDFKAGGEVCVFNSVFAP